MGHRLPHLRISLNTKLVGGAYGGGNQFANILDEYLSGRGHAVFRHLVPDLDLILIVNAGSRARITAYGEEQVRLYRQLNPNCMVVHRVNSCDEQRGLDLGINNGMLTMNLTADYSIFISQFIRDLFAGKGLDLGKGHKVILNGADEEIFYPAPTISQRDRSKIRIVTHHWSSNFMKGFDVYERLDRLLAIDPYRDLFEFTVIGNVPVGVTLANSQVIPPTSGTALAERLRQQDIYLTAARNEAAGMHHVEGMRCGLPVLYLETGALPEYCGPYGMPFQLYNFEAKLLQISESLSDLKQLLGNCPYGGRWMAAQYEDLFISLVSDRRVNPLPQPSIWTKGRARLSYLRKCTAFETVNHARKAWRFLRT